MESAIRELNYQPDRIAARLARGREYRFWFILPTTAGEFMQSIVQEVEDSAQRMSAERVAIMVKRVDVFDGELLAQTLDALGEDVDGVAVVALDHPAVREVDQCAGGAGHDRCDAGVRRAGIQAHAFCRHRQFVGGAHGGGLDGAFPARAKKARSGLFAGSLSLRDHIERQFGFEQVMAHEFPHFEILPVRESRDDVETTESLTAQLLKEHKDLVGIYNVGGGTKGIVAGLEVFRPRQGHCVHCP